MAFDKVKILIISTNIVKKILMIIKTEETIGQGKMTIELLKKQRHISE